MNPTSYTYNGITVEYTDQQKQIIVNDQNTIQDLQQQVRNKQGEIGQLESDIQSAMAAVSENPYGACWSQVTVLPGIKKWVKDDNCYNTNNANWSAWRAQQQTLQGQIDNINNVQLPAASKKLNDDITTIQNDIKLQIQATQTTANNANLPQQSQLNNQQTLASIAAQAAADKDKREQQTKVVAFVLIAAVVVTIATLFIKSN